MRSCGPACSASSPASDTAARPRHRRRRSQSSQSSRDAALISALALARKRYTGPYDPGRGSLLSQTDPAGYLTSGTYDALAVAARKFDPSVPGPVHQRRPNPQPPESIPDPVGAAAQRPTGRRGQHGDLERPAFAFGRGRGSDSPGLEDTRDARGLAGSFQPGSAGGSGFSDCPPAQ